MSRNLRQNVVVLIVAGAFFASSFATGVESAQTSKKAKAAPTPVKKTVKAAATPDKKAQTKATPAAKKGDASKNTPDDKKTTAKTSAKDAVNYKNSSKDRSDSKSKAANSKQTASSESKGKAADKKTVSKATDSKSKKAASKSNAADSKSKKPDSKNSTQNSTAKNSKSAPTVKNTASSGKNTSAVKALPAKTPTVKTNASNKSASNFAPKTETNASEKSVGGAPQIIVTDLSARIRSQAKASAPELRQAKLGTILQVSEKTPAWYRVQFVTGVKTGSGWISANSVNDLNSAGKEQIYRQIADRYYRDEAMNFETASELSEFLTRAAADLGESNSAELELKRLLALRAALKNVPADKTDENPYRDFLKAQGKTIVYSEPSGAWMVSSNLFWDLHKKYVKSPLADQIAWEAAQNPLPGECEGYVNCHLFYARMTSGEYLSLHPSGKKNLEALTNLTNLLDPIAASLNGAATFTGPSDVTDRAEFNNLIAELRTIVSRLPLTEKERPLRQLRVIAEGFR